MRATARLPVLIALCALLIGLPAACSARAREVIHPPAEEVAAGVAELPFRLVSDHIILSASINGSDEIDILLDTGMPLRGVIVLDPSLVEGISLDYVGTLDLGGGGSDGPRTADVAARATVSISGNEFTGQRVMILREGDFADDWPVAAIIGRTLFDHVVEIDFASSVIRLYESADRIPGGPGERIELDFTMGIPVVDAAVKTNSTPPLPVTLIADTGVNDSFLLFEYSHDGLDLPDNTIRCKGGVLGEGLTGDMLGTLGRIPALEVGPFTLTDVITGYPDEETMGHAAMLGQNGFMGIGIMKRFTVVFDYGDESLYLKPNQSYSQPFEWNMAGLLVWVNRNGYLQVKDIVESSPGWENGIRPGDVIIAVDGTTIKDMSNTEVFDAFSRDGAEVSLTILRDADHKTVSLKLRRLI